MNRTCSCGGVMRAYKSDSEKFSRKCDRCGRTNTQRKRQAGMVGLIDTRKDPVDGSVAVVYWIPIADYKFSLHGGDIIARHHRIVTPCHPRLTDHGIEWYHGDLRVNGVTHFIPMPRMPS